MRAKKLHREEKDVNLLDFGAIIVGVWGVCQTSDKHCALKRGHNPQKMSHLTFCGELTCVSTEPLTRDGLSSSCVSSGWLTRSTSSDHCLTLQTLNGASLRATLTLHQSLFVHTCLMHGLQCWCIGFMMVKGPTNITLQPAVISVWYPAATDNGNTNGNRNGNVNAGQVSTPTSLPTILPCGPPLPLSRTSPHVPLPVAMSLWKSAAVRAMSGLLQRLPTTTLASGGLSFMGSGCGGSMSTGSGALTSTMDSYLQNTWSGLHPAAYQNLGILLSQCRDVDPLVLAKLYNMETSIRVGGRLLHLQPGFRLGQLPLWLRFKPAQIMTTPPPMRECPVHGLFLQGQCQWSMLALVRELIVGSLREAEPSVTIVLCPSLALAGTLAALDSCAPMTEWGALCGERRNGGCIVLTYDTYGSLTSCELSDLRPSRLVLIDWTRRMLQNLYRPLCPLIGLHLPRDLQTACHADVLSLFGCAAWCLGLPRASAVDCLTMSNIIQQQTLQISGVRSTALSLLPLVVQGPAEEPLLSMTESEQRALERSPAPHRCYFLTQAITHPQRCMVTRCSDLSSFTASRLPSSLFLRTSAAQPSTECIICWGAVDTMAPCGHWFCSICLDRLLQPPGPSAASSTDTPSIPVARRCPACKASLTNPHKPVLVQELHHQLDKHALTVVARLCQGYSTLLITGFPRYHPRFAHVLRTQYKVNVQVLRTFSPNLRARQTALGLATGSLHTRTPQTWLLAPDEEIVWQLLVGIKRIVLLWPWDSAETQIRCAGCVAAWAVQHCHLTPSAEGTLELPKVFCVHRHTHAAAEELYHSLAQHNNVCADPNITGTSWRQVKVVY